MEDQILTQVQDRYQLEMLLLRLQRQAEDTDAALRQAKFDLRAAQQELVLYSGSFRSFRDKLTGKKEETETALRHAVQKAEANLASARRQKEMLDAHLSELKEKLASAPDWDALREQAGAETLPEWNRLEAMYCAEALLPLLEENHAALLEQRNMMSGANVGKVYTYSEQAEVYSAPEKAGRNCRPYILRLKAALAALDIPFIPCTYFDDPTAFVNAVIAQHNRRDRLNEAINQVEAVQKQISRLMEQLE